MREPGDRVPIFGLGPWSIDFCKTNEIFLGGESRVIIDKINICSCIAAFGHTIINHK